MKIYGGLILELFNISTRIVTTNYLDLRGNITDKLGNLTSISRNCSKACGKSGSIPNFTFDQLFYIL
ncbi:hypothetical protein L1887_09403 [Cichorium endivia]|nr:hypothetical protein L1887_09403 [Cichorium endivia]